MVAEINKDLEKQEDKKAWTFNKKMYPLQWLLFEGRDFVLVMMYELDTLLGIYEDIHLCWISICSINTVESDLSFSLLE